MTRVARQPVPLVGHVPSGLLKQILLGCSRGRCTYCGERLTLRTVTADHVRPKARGGTSRLANLAASCARCNELKGDRLLSELPPDWWREKPR